MVGGIDVHYLSGGEGDPLVVIHGGGDSARSWRKNLEVLAEHYTVYAPDLPGFGSSQCRCHAGGATTDDAHIAGQKDFIKTTWHDIVR